MRRASLFIVLVSLFLAACSKEPAAGPDVSSGRGPLRVGMEAAYPPFESITPDGKFEGFDVDLARALGEHLGRPVEFKNMGDYAALIPELQAGRIDVICSGMSYTEERAKKVDFSKPYAQSPMRVLVSTERAKDVTAIADLDAEDVHVAVQRGTTGESKARAAFPKATILLFDSEADAAREVASARVHAFVYDAASVEKFAQQYPDQTRMLEGDLGAEQYCMVVAKGSSLRAHIDAFLEKATVPGGTIDAIAAKWLPHPERWRVTAK